MHTGNSTMDADCCMRCSGPLTFGAADWKDQGRVPQRVEHKHWQRRCS